MHEEDQYTLDPAWLIKCNIAFRKADVDAGRSGYPGGLDSLRDVFAQLLSEASNDRLKQLIARRVFIHCACMLAFASDAPLKDCQLIFEDYEQIGFRDLYTESTVRVVYARYLERLGHAERAIDILLGAKSKLDRAIASLSGERGIVVSALKEFRKK